MNQASSPWCPQPKGEAYVFGGCAPWPHEGKSTLREQATNALILKVPAERAGLRVYHFAFDLWKCFHQSAYHPYEIFATGNIVRG